MYPTKTGIHLGDIYCVYAIKPITAITKLPIKFIISIWKASLTVVCTLQ